MSDTNKTEGQNTAQVKDVKKDPQYVADAKNQEQDEDEAFRPRIRTYAQGKFRVNDSVYVNSGRGLAGPYLVASCPQPQHYTLCTQDGAAIENSRVWKEGELRAA